MEPPSGPTGLSIGALSRATRIPVETLRTWERRYGAPRAIRKPSGHRLYPPETVDHLQRVARLLALGFRAAEVLGRTDEELEAMLASAGRAQPRASGGGGEPDGEIVPRLLHAAKRLDREAILTALRSALMRLGLLDCLEHVATPFMVSIGTAWSEDRLCVRHEHFASACLRDFLARVREPLDNAANGPRVAAAMFPGDQHEAGLLMACAVIAQRGCRVTYLGPDSPVEEIAAAARSAGAEAVVISISPILSRSRALREIEKLRRALPSRFPIWVGGAGAPASAKGVECFDSLKRLNVRLDAFV